jgi:hypothetical protein
MEEEILEKNMWANVLKRFLENKNEFIINLNL